MSGVRSYAVTSHCAHGLTSERVLMHSDTGVLPDLLKSRIGYVSRASHEATVLTNDCATLGQQLRTKVGKSSAFELEQDTSISQDLAMSIH